MMTRLSKLRERYANEQNFKNLVEVLRKWVRDNRYSLDDISGAVTILRRIIMSDSGGLFVGSFGQAFGKKIVDMSDKELRALTKNSRYRSYVIAELKRRENVKGNS